MLGKKVSGLVDLTKKKYTSKLGTSICHAFINDETSNKKTEVYLISKNNVSLNFEGIIVAEVNIDSSKTNRLIVAQKGHVYYEPCIRRMIMRLQKNPIKSLKCKYEKSCGAIVFFQDGVDTKILLVKNKNTSHWGFPKGHVEEYETETKTATREIKEETGLDVKILKGFRQSVEYYSAGGAKKKVVIFLAKSPHCNVVLQKNELDAFIWVNYEQALKLFEFETNVKILKKAINFLKGKRSLKHIYESKNI